MLPDVPIRCHTDPALALADLYRIGLALLDAVPGPQQLIELSEALGATIVPHRDSRPDGVTVIEDRGSYRAEFAGFTRAALPPHTDRSGQPDPPDLLMTICGREPSSGGEALPVDGHAVYLDLSRNAPDALAALAAPRSAMFGRADGYLGSVFTRQPSGIITVRLRLDDLAHFSPAAAPHIPILRSTVHRHTRALLAQTGTGYVVDNRRWLHGRRGYAGPRIMYRIMATARSGSILGGFIPTDAADGLLARSSVISTHPS